VGIVDVLHTIEMVVAELEQSVVDTIFDLLVIYVDVDDGSP
jgi:hypothetical protein